MNSLMLGITMYVTSGFSQQAPPPLNRFGVGKFLEVPLTVYVLIVIAAIAIFILEKTTVGRRFIATSVNPDAALTVGIPLDAYRVATYTLAGFCYAAAGVLLAGYVLSPTVFSGMPYLLATVAAVVVGGNPIGGGLRGSVTATMSARCSSPTSASSCSPSASRHRPRISCRPSSSSPASALSKRDGAFASNGSASSSGSRRLTSSFGFERPLPEP